MDYVTRLSETSSHSYNFQKQHPGIFRLLLLVVFEDVLVIQKQFSPHLKLGKYIRFKGGKNAKKSK